MDLSFIEWADLAPFIAVGFVAQMVDGAIRPPLMQSCASARQADGYRAGRFHPPVQWCFGLVHSRGWNDGERYSIP